MSFPEYVRVTDEVKPRREYSIVASTFDAEIHQKLEKTAAAADGTPLAAKHTPVELATGEGYGGWKVDRLRSEVEKRGLTADKPGNKPELVAALLADDESAAVATPPESLAGTESGQSAENKES